MAAFEPKDDADWLLYELGGKHRTQVLSTLSALGVPDHLRDAGPATVAELATARGCDEGALESLLRAAAGMGCLDEPSPDTFELTPRGRELCTDRLGAFATCLGGREQWDPWSRLRDAMRERDGQTAFEHAFGAPMYEHLPNEQRAAAEYDAAIDAFTRMEVRRLHEHVDLSRRRCLVDVGGGQGALLQELLVHAPDARAVLFDLPHVITALRGRLPDRVEAVAGDFFQSVPEGGDVYLLKHVLHNWDDDRAVQLLANCREAKAEGGVVVVLDAVLSPDNRPDLARMLDLEMRVLCGGRERRRPELRRLLQRAGLAVESMAELTASTWVFVAR